METIINYFLSGYEGVDRICALMLMVIVIDSFFDLIRDILGAVMKR